MISEAEALDRVLSSITPLEHPVTLSPIEALGHFAAAPVLARLANPRFDYASVDGYAVPPGAEKDSVLRLAAEQPAGPDRHLTVLPGETVRIFTGAPLPAGTHAVVMQEDVTVIDNTVKLTTPVARGEGIRRTGADVCEGQKLLSPGEPITPAMVGLLASQGFTSIAVGRMPALAILSTGDELVPPAEPLSPGKIHESNSSLLAALFRRHGAVAQIRHRHIEDNPASLALALGNALDESDAVILTGGVSVGDHDYTRRAFADCSVTSHLWRVRIKPGKPFLFGSRRNRPVFGLPGNPVSSFVTAILFVLPAIRRLAGASPSTCLNRPVPVRLATAVENLDSRPHYLRGSLDPDGFTPSGLQESHALRGLASAQAIARVEPGTSLLPGSFLPAILL